MKMSPHTPVVARSPEWPRVAKAHLQLEPQCVCCGPLWKASTPVQVHHIFPVHFARASGRPDLELDPRNLVTLCCSLASRPGQDHHLVVGHLDDFESLNPSSRADAVRYRGLTSVQIKMTATWRMAAAAKAPPLAAMTTAQRASLRALMNRVMPLVSSK